MNFMFCWPCSSVQGCW